jgi:acetyl-CoA acetyltransferase
LVPVTQHRIAVVGCGYTELTRRPERPEIDLAIEACRMAADDAGIEPSMIDGIEVQVHHYPMPDIGAIAAGLGMQEVRWNRAGGGGGIMALANLVEVLDSRAADAIMVCKVMNTAAPISTPAIDPEDAGVPGPGQFEVPYGLGYTMQRIGLPARRWMHRYGITAEQVGWLCVVQREHAALNPYAYFKKPLTIDEYLESRWITDPVRLLDCDAPVNGAYAYIITRDDLARSLRHPPVYIHGSVVSDLPLLEQHLLPEDLDGPTPLAQQLYRETGLTPEHMDLWMLYDGYSFFVLQWMENLGLVGRGESGPYVEGGDRIRIGGEHPVNTFGGQLSEGRMHMAGHIIEATQQLRGTAGPRQVGRNNFAVVTSAFPNTGAAAIFGRE